MSPELKKSHIGFEYDVVRTNRKKSASIKVYEGRVEFVIPKTLSDDDLLALVKKKSRWVKSKLKEQEQASPVREKQFVSGESFQYLGKNYRLKLVDDT